MQASLCQAQAQAPASCLIAQLNTHKKARCVMATDMSSRSGLSVKSDAERRFLKAYGIT
jgi:hypothetical protein